MSAERLDIDAESADAIELEATLDTIARGASLAESGRRLRAMRAWVEVEPIRERLAEVAEMRDWIGESGRPVPAGLGDPRDTIAQLRVEGAPVEARLLRELATLLLRASAIGRELRGGDRERWPRLRERGASFADLSAIASTIVDATDREGRLLDGASPELARIRRAIARSGETLQRRLLQMARRPASQGTIRDDYVTERNGRFVVPVRTDAPHPLRGIVHGASSSGATQFVEPLDAVELNNERVELFERELEEERRLVAAWTAALAARIEEIDAAFDALVELDALQALALFADAHDAVEPEVVAERSLLLRRARHPLLERHLREREEAIVPLDLELDPADRVLVISGPNTGGKTVALKTLALCAVLAQCGVPVPADRARLPIYRQLRADVGDRQSISDDLSTFSAHLRSLGGVLRDARAPALYLFDELGTGTEPGEGGALAEAVLDRLARPGTTVVATTHLGRLKAWSLNDPRAVAAAMDFDTETLRPTYRLIEGVAGISAGIDIAERLGLPAEVVAGARERLDDETLQGQRMLSRLRELIDEQERRIDAVGKREVAMTEREVEVEGRLTRERERIRVEGEARLAEHRARLDRRLQHELERLPRAQSARAGRKARERLAAEARGFSARERAESAAEGSVALPARVERGAQVLSRAFGRVGQVVEDRGETIEVAFGGARFSLPREQLALPGGPPPKRTAALRPAPEVTDLGDLAPHELKLIGERVEPALERVDRFLDRAVLAGHREVRLVHGHGSGRLRAAVRELLSAHAHVARWRGGDRYEGGDGATIATLR